MKTSQFYEMLKPDRAPLEALGFNPYYQRLGGLNAGRPRCAGHEYFDLASNDYLGLASDPRIHQAMIAAIRQYGASMCGTPIATGYVESLGELEEALARFVGLQEAAVFPSCYQANVALFPALATGDDVIIVDHYAHASLGQGIRSAGCKIKPFLHNNVEHLARQLAGSSGFRQIFVVTESVFSTEGSVAPLDKIVDLCRGYEAIPVVDDSHGLGVLGRSGRGILEEKGITGYTGIYTASLGKALAHSGGMVAGPHALIEALRYTCPGLIYSTALPPACIGGLLRTLEIITSDFGALRNSLWSHHALLTDRLLRHGFDLQRAEAPIASIRCGSTENTLRWAKTFFEHQILTTPFVPPSVPSGNGVLRLIVGAKLQEMAMAALMQALEGVGAQKRGRAVAPANLLTNSL
jgi:7-keto-8-aminopelargonate synthetase-like enzyme